ncbi:MAG: hypothetical protein R2684_12695 [Pyrinomonadaceae bacterium]
MKTRLLKIDDICLSQYSFLTREDCCFYFGEYFSGQGYGYSPTNNLIHNLKKSPSRRGKPEWKYKLHAIETVADWIASVDDLLWDDPNSLWIPVPPSKSIEDKDYDDRLVKILESLKRKSTSFSFSELITVKESIEGSHNLADGMRPRPEDHLENFVVDETLILPEPKTVFVFDDVITTGSHFRAVDTLLRKKFRNTVVYGIFVARAVRLAQEF